MISVIGKNIWINIKVRTWVSECANETVDGGLMSCVGYLINCFPWGA